MKTQPRSLLFLTLGDIVTILVVSLIGFASHQSSLLSPRLPATFFPVLAAWLVTAPWLGLFDSDRRCRLSSWWRVLLAMLIAAPLAAWLRALWLGGAAIQPVFVAVIGGTNALGLVLWRVVWSFLCSRMKPNG